jgi:hypothetical protein
VRGDCHSVNGGIHVGRNSNVDSLSSVNGGIALRQGSLVHGDIVVEKANRGRDWRKDERDLLKIEIEGGSVVEGDIIVEDPDLRVEVFIRGGGRVDGWAGITALVVGAGMVGYDLSKRKG